MDLEKLPTIGVFIKVFSDIFSLKVLVNIWILSDVRLVQINDEYLKFILILIASPFSCSLIDDHKQIISVGNIGINDLDLNLL